MPQVQIDLDNELTRDEFKELVRNKKRFRVEFIKRTDGSYRVMENAEFGVKDFLKGGTKPYSDKAKNLLTVYDWDKNGYRSIPVDAIKVVRLLNPTGQNLPKVDVNYIQSVIAELSAYLNK